MIRTTLVLAVGLLALIASGCTQHQVSTADAGPRAGAGPRLTCVSSDPNTFPPFLKNARFLQAAYNPDPNFHVGQVATPPGGQPPLTDPYLSSLCDAYNAAPDFFKTQLDGLTGTFIVPQTDCPVGSNCMQSFWGLRDRDSKTTYIALSTGLWDAAGDVPLYAAHESSICSNLLQVSCPVTFKPSANTQTMTVLAALAHEFGHVAWWAWGIYDRTCQNTDFSKFSWNKNKQADRFHYFGIQQAENTPNGNGPQKDNVKQSADKPNELNKIYSGGEWASLFATVNPDEDFAETYKLMVLTGSQLKELKVFIPGHNIVDIVLFLSDGNKRLRKKTDWISSCLPPS
jgi:hypothetical protein